LLHAAEALQAEIADELITRGASVAGADRNGETALHRLGDLRRAPPETATRLALLLLDRGAPVDARNRDDVTPLHQAVPARSLARVTVAPDGGATRLKVSRRSRGGPLRSHRG